MHSRIRPLYLWGVLTLILAGGMVVASWSQGWLGPVRKLVDGVTAAAPEHAEAEHAEAGHQDGDAHSPAGESVQEGHEEHEDHEAADEHEGHEHTAAATKQYNHVHDEANALELSQQATATLGLNLQPVELRPFAQTLSLPASIMPRPGASQVQVSAAFAGTVTRVYHLEGEAIEPGAALFDLRLTHEELVQAQADFLQTAEELAVVQRELERLKKITESGVIPGRLVLEREYERQKLDAALRSHRQRLLLHGLPEKKVDDILATRQLLQELTVRAPDRLGNEPLGDRLLEIHTLKVTQGQNVEAGAALCTLTDHAVLYLQGKAFEDDLAKLTVAARNGWPVTAVFEPAEGERQLVEGLKILYLANEVDASSRALSFYVSLPNQLLRNTKNDTGQRFIDWRYRPGQRARLLVSVEAATPRIVLPVEAVVRDGVESYVFEYNQGHFDRRAVHVEYRDQDRVVVANDGILKPGVQVAVRGAYQLHLAAKNRSAPPIDPHAGHNH